MSPPVLGSLMALCIAYILPSSNGWLPIESEEPSTRNYVKEYKDAGSNDYVSVVLPNDCNDHCARLENVKTSLFGIYCVPPPASTHRPCNMCGKKFLDCQLACEWRTRTKVKKLHDSCLLDYTLWKNRERETLSRARRLAMKTGSMLCLAAL